MGGWIRPSQGTVRIDGMRFENHERALRAVVKLVPDTPMFYPELNAREHIELVIRTHRRHNSAGWRDQTAEWLRGFGLDRNQQAYPSSFSRGMQYKLAVILSMLAEPRLLLLDEPFGPLDPYSQNFLAERLKSSAKQGMSVIASTHLLPSHYPPDRAIMLDQGEVALDSAFSTLWQPDTGEALARVPEAVMAEVHRQRRSGADG